MYAISDKSTSAKSTVCGQWRQGRVSLLLTARMSFVYTTPRRRGVAWWVDGQVRHLQGARRDVEKGEIERGRRIHDLNVYQRYGPACRDDRFKQQIFMCITTSRRTVVLMAKSTTNKFNY